MKLTRSLIAVLALCLGISVECRKIMIKPKANLLLEKAFYLKSLNAFVKRHRRCPVSLEELVEPSDSAFDRVTCPGRYVLLVRGDWCRVVSRGDDCQAGSTYPYILTDDDVLIAEVGVRPSWVLLLDNIRLFCVVFSLILIFATALYYLKTYLRHNERVEREKKRDS